MGFNFPYGNKQQLNLDWFLRKFKELVAAWNEKEESIDGALDAEIQKAEDALSDVYTARDVTVAAKNDALQAKADALTAAANAAQYWQNAAASANSAATSAVTALQAAQDAADDADQTSRDRAGVTADKATVAADKAAVAADKAAVQQDKDDTDLLKDAANAAALRAEGWADGEQNGTPVTSESPYYENSAKYYKEAAEDVLESIPPDYTELADEVASQSEKIDELKSAFDNILYPNEDVVVSSTDATAQATANVYYDISLLKANNKYRIVLTISNAIHLSNIRTSKSESGSGNVDTVTNTFTGDSWASGKTLIYTPSVEGIKYLQVQFNSAYVASEATVTIVVYDYSKEQTTAIQELDNNDIKIKQSVSAITPEIYLEDEYNLLPPYGYTVGKMILPTGVITDYGSNILSDFIPIDPSQEYICNWAKTVSVVYGNSGLTGNINTFERNNFCFFDENKNVIPFTGDSTKPSKAIPSNAKYIRVTITSEELYPLARLIYGNFATQPIIRICDYHKRLADIYTEANTGMENFKMVMFGDSITHGSLSAGDNGISYVDYANDYLHSNIINVGFGGTRMTYPTLEGAALFCFYNLCDCIVSDDPDAWDDLDDYATNTNTSYLPHLNTLKAIDWSTVNAIGLMYGVNDYTSNTPVGTEYNETLTNYDGACAYGLKKLLTKYPHLQVIILAPFDREMTAGDATSMTDRQANTAGLLMSDYADSLEHVVSRFHCPLIKTGELFGINQYNILLYASDGTHPRSNIAQKRLGWLFAQAVKTHLAPFNG